LTGQKEDRETEREGGLKSYAKPVLRKLGLLRLLTRFSF
jgi:hypothetical protein